MLGKANKESRIGVMSEAIWQGKQSPSFYVKNHTITERKPYAYKMTPALEIKKVEKVNLGPASYDPL